MTASSEVLDALHVAFPKVPVGTIKTITDIEGFNDSQALPDDGASDVGPLARLYIVPVRYADSEFVDTWRLTSILDIDGHAAMPASYKNLGIKDNPTREQYCVYLQRRTTGSTYKWEAAVSEVDGGKCRPADDGHKINNVAEERESGTTKADFPSVVRFDQDKNQKTVIGVNCGAQVWCEIGRPDGVGNRLDPVHAALGALQTKKHRIKSWHDEQEVVGSTMKRNIGRASVTPDENLGLYTMLDFTESGGVPVAYVYLDQAVTDAASKYAKWGLAQGNNTVTLFAQETTTSGQYDWWATFTTAAGTTNGKRFKVNPMYHGMKPPPVARWKWDPADEELWIACELGCCTVTGGFSLVEISSAPIKKD